IDGLEYAKSLPHRSIELWPNDSKIDYVAHLRRSPQRDLGILMFSRDSHKSVVMPWTTFKETIFSSRRSIVGSMAKSGLLRYSMQSAMAEDLMSPTEPPTTEPAEEMAPEGHEDFQKHL